MVTTRIEIKPHLKEYLLGKFNNFQESPITFPDKLDIYHTIWDLTEKRPVNCPVDKGNLEIVLPDRQEGKNPECYNYLGVRSQQIIERKIETKFFAELHDFLDEQKHRYGISYIETIHEYMRKYGILSISEDALLKNYYRWRDVVRKKNERREYKKTKLVAC